MVSRSSLAARRGARSSASNGVRLSTAIGCSSKEVGEGAGPVSRREGVSRDGSIGAPSLMFSASWMAERATSVGSFTFFGVFAISVYAPMYAFGEPADDGRGLFRPHPGSPQSMRCEVAARSSGLVPYFFKHPIGWMLRMKWSALRTF